MEKRWLAVGGCLLAISSLGCDDDKGGGSTGAPSASAPSVSASANTSASAAPAKVSEAPALTGDLQVVAEGSPMTIYPLGEAAIVDTGAFYAVLGEGPLEQDPRLFRASYLAGATPTVSVALQFKAFFGAYPHQVWADSSEGKLRRVNDVFAQQDFLRDGESLLDIAAWENKRAVAAIAMSKPDIRFQLVGSSPGGVVPAPGKPTADQGECAVRMNARALKLAGLPSGHLFAAGTECKTDKPIAEVWQPRSVRGEAAPIEGISGAPEALAAASAEEAYALFNDGSTGYLATWDGKAWKGEKSPFGVGKAIFVAGDGTAFAVGGEGLFKHPKGGAWKRVDTGTGRVTSAWAKDEKVIWAATADGKLLRAGAPATPPIRLNSAHEVSAIVARDKRWPATPACKRNFVLIAALGPASGKAPSSYAGLTEAVRGDASLTAPEIQYLVEESGGQLFAGAKVPSYTLAQRLISALTAKNPRNKPLAFCHEPAAVKGALRLE